VDVSVGVGERFRLDGRVAIVTGASRGIGRAIAVGLADAGASVVAASRDVVACRAVVDEIEQTGAKGLAVACDIGDLAAHTALLDATIERFGRLDVLVNNAGVLRPHHTVKVTEAELDALLAVNLKGPLFLSVAALPHLAANGGGSIVNIGALGASQPMEGIGAYCAVKAAMANWSTTMAREWAAQRVRVNVLVPGSVATDMILPVDPERRAAFIEQMRTQNVFGRLAEPDDLVGAAVFLASDASSYMTGRSLFVDGGMLR
jgi:NAD(P)-dependent dehydrogenase (short-subunit alcohol dehydrogenase family)